MNLENQHGAIATSSQPSRRPAARTSLWLNVQAVPDASGAPFDFSEDSARRRMVSEGVILTATNTVIAELAQDWTRPKGQELFKLIFSDVLPPIKSGWFS